MNTFTQKRQQLGLSALAVGLYFVAACEHTASRQQRRAGSPKIRVAQDRHAFVDARGKPFIPIGINYFRPGTGWAPQVWKKFDAVAVRQDFERMRCMGLNCVRVFLTYGSFYRRPGVLEPEALSKFDQFLQIAEETGIYVHPTGPDQWEGLPDWGRPSVAGESSLEALEAFWKLFAARYKGRNAIFAYDLRNEPSVEWNGAELRSKWNV